MGRGRIFTYMDSVDSYGFFVGTYTVRPMDFTNGWLDDSYPTTFYSIIVL